MLLVSRPLIVTLASKGTERSGCRSRFGRRGAGLGQYRRRRGHDRHRLGRLKSRRRLGDGLLRRGRRQRRLRRRGAVGGRPSAAGVARRAAIAPATAVATPVPPIRTEQQATDRPRPPSEDTARYRNKSDSTECSTGYSTSCSTECSTGYSMGHSHSHSPRPPWDGNNPTGRPPRSQQQQRNRRRLRN